LIRSLLLRGCLMLSVSACSAQSASDPNTPPQQTAPADSPSQPAPRNRQQKSQKEREIEKQEQSQRTLGVLPDFLATNRQDASPLTPTQKFHLFAKQSFDPVEFVVIGAQAGLSQADNQFPGYGQGTQGYAKRYGAAFADQVSSGFWSNFFYPTIFKDDPRYFRLGEGSFTHRGLYSVRQEFVAHTDRGGRTFNFSNVLGALTAGGISNLYYPADDRGFGLTMSRAGIALAYGAAGGLVEEFGPDVRRKLFGKRRRDHPKP